jgi:hypothetical protein
VEKLEFLFEECLLGSRIMVELISNGLFEPEQKTLAIQAMALLCQTAESLSDQIELYDHQQALVRRYLSGEEN